MPIEVKNICFRHIINFLPITLGAIALSGIVAACNSTTPNPTSSTPSTSASPMAMNHGGMTHSMDLGTADVDYDLRFIDAMVPHHEGALVMAQDMAQKTKRPELQKLAKTIVSAQTEEIAQMQQWRKAWYPKAANTPMSWSPEMKHMMAMPPDQISAMKMDVNLGKADTEYDLRFLKAMVPHHEAAVVMAKDLAQKIKRPELQKLGSEHSHITAGRDCPNAAVGKNLVQQVSRQSG
jgi:uncharacterized protein (DUF305 family)